MNTKPISPKMHGIIDYTFAAGLLILPPLLGLNKKAKNLYKIMAAEMLLYSSLTDYPAGLTPLIPYETHHKLDIVNVAGMAGDTFFKGIRKQKRAIIFHIAATTLALATVLLTDWQATPENTFTEPETVTITEELIIVVEDDNPEAII